jgi:hypothetical protein
MPPQPDIPFPSDPANRGGSEVDHHPNYFPSGSDSVTNVESWFEDLVNVLQVPQTSDAVTTASAQASSILPIQPDITDLMLRDFQVPASFQGDSFLEPRTDMNPVRKLSPEELIC